ncbi:DUF3040 domain-containing protein [Actinokineospora cianjurensis]|uniref:DUF3040 family protein n=1 Tax=Actinokineospora cianjurensis TaxID=585224 RepID=A0A421B2F9_9PSEU|nr:DUF3040 domain-containing protein [Actinokineospora cianjurensis]RLK58606.1 Protein of unknown function (DUF3040) [Actinokineospora cianjurensis]
MNPRELSGHERRALEEIAGRLSADSPRLASLLGEREQVMAPTLASLGLAVAAGGVCAVVGFVLGAPLLVFVGMVAAVAVLLVPSRRAESGESER